MSTALRLQADWSNTAIPQSPFGPLIVATSLNPLILTSLWGGRSTPLNPLGLSLSQARGRHPALPVGVLCGAAWLRDVTVYADREPPVTMPGKFRQIETIPTMPARSWLFRANPDHPTIRDSSTECRLPGGARGRHTARTSTGPTRS